MRTFPYPHIKEFQVFKKLSTPGKIQDFLDTLPINFEKNGNTSHSPLETLRRREAHCMEGALVAAAALWYHGKPPLLIDLKTTRDDDDHVITLFKVGKHYGAISKTNHNVLRYRDPVYKSVHELALSYFHEYFLNNGKKTLRSFSKPFSLLSYKDDWLTDSKSVWHINNEIDTSPHISIVHAGHEKSLRRASAIEIEAGRITEW